MEKITLFRAKLTEDYKVYYIETIGYDIGNGLAVVKEPNHRDYSIFDIASGLYANFKGFKNLLEVESFLTTAKYQEFLKEILKARETFTYLCKVEELERYKKERR